MHPVAMPTTRKKLERESESMVYTDSGIQKNHSHYIPVRACPFDVAYIIALFIIVCGERNHEFACRV
jgi:hypothetical protein